MKLLSKFSGLSALCPLLLFPETATADGGLSSLGALRDGLIAVLLLLGFFILLFLLFRLILVQRKNRTLSWVSIFWILPLILYTFYSLLLVTVDPPKPLNIALVSVVWAQFVLLAVNLFKSSRWRTFGLALVIAGFGIWSTNSPRWFLFVDYTYLDNKDELRNIEYDNSMYWRVLELKDGRRLLLVDETLRKEDLDVAFKLKPALNTPRQSQFDFMQYQVSKEFTYRNRSKSAFVFPIKKTEVKKYTQETKTRGKFKLITENTTMPDYLLYEAVGGKTSLPVEGDQLAWVKELLAHGANPNFYSKPYKESVLGVAIKRNNYEVVEVLLKEGRANANGVAGWPRRTPLYFAVMKRNAKIVKLLVDSGGNPNQRDKKGVSANDLLKKNLGYAKNDPEMQAKLLEIQSLLSRNRPRVL